MLRSAQRILDARGLPESGSANRSGEHAGGTIADRMEHSKTDCTRGRSRGSSGPRRRVALALVATLAAGSTGRADHLLRADAAEPATLVIPPAPTADGLAPEGWYVVIGVDVLELEEDAQVTLRFRADDMMLQSVRRSRAGDELPLRHHLLYRSLLGSGEGVELWIDVEASEGARVGALHVERFHEAPSRALLGKANGPFGPDLLSCGPLGFTGLTEHGCSAFPILEVLPGGPAAEAGLAPGDLVVGVGGRPLEASSLAPGWAWFEDSHEAALGRALEAAVRGGDEHLRIDVLRGGSQRALELAQPLRGDLDGFPLEGELGEALRGDLLAWAVAHQRPNGGWPGTDAVNPALGALGMLGTRDRAHAEAIDRAVQYLLDRHPRPSEMTGLAYWTIAFQGMLFCEYHLAGGSIEVLPWIEEAIAWLPETTHECRWGMPAFGHGPDGLPYDEKALMAPAAHLLVFDALARRCGVESRVWEHIRPYVEHSWSDPANGGHGAMGYNASYRDQDEFWSRSGLVALATTLRGEDGPMRQPLCDVMRERHPWMLNSHAYGEPGAALGLLGLAVADREAFDEVLAQWGWRFLGAWEPGHGLRYTTPHMGAPYMGGESVVNLAYLVLAAAEDGGLVLAGGDATEWLRD